jgi:oligoribonuclease
MCYTHGMLGIFLDTETTGLHSRRHCPIDIALKVLDLSSGKILGATQHVIRPTPEQWEQRDPISMGINGLTWEEVAKGNDADIVGKEIISFFSNLHIQRTNAVFICQNPSFDRAFFNHLVDVYVQELLNWPYHWLDLASMYWMARVQQAKGAGASLPDKLSFSKDEIAKYYHLPTETSPHRAAAGVDHLILCYQAVMQAAGPSYETATV